MSAFLRRTSTRQLLLAVAALAAVVVGGTAIAVAATQNTATPPSRALAPALRTALAGAHQVEGVSADITFTNNLVSGASLPGANPLLTGAAGRLWVSSDGRARLELQGTRGDTEILLDGRTLTLYDRARKSVYELVLPQASSTTTADAVPSLAAIQALLDRIGGHARISSPVPSNVAGQEAYTVRLAPKQGGGLLTAVQLAWDAANGTPLQIAVYAAGNSSPVLELQASDIAYGPVDHSALAISPPPGTHVVKLSWPASRAGAQSAVTGAAPVQRQLAFQVSAPTTLAGLPLGQVRLLEHGTRKGALVTYGSGLGGLAVLELPSGSGNPAAGGVSGSLPTVSINGIRGHELATALGTVVTFARGGVSFVVAGSVPAAVAEAAARGL